jgi:hypothetical protein
MSTLDAQGIVRHLFIVHPDLKEKSPGSALDFDLTVTQAKFTAHNVRDTDRDSKVHADGPHFDVLDPAELDAKWIPGDKWDFFTVHLVANHCDSAPAPKAQLLQVTQAEPCFE